MPQDAPMPSLFTLWLPILVSTLVVFPGAFLVRRRRGAPPPPSAARLVAGLAGALNLGLLV